MAQQRFTELRVGIFVVVCLALIAGLILKFGKYEKLAKKSYAVTVIFSDVGGIVRDPAGPRHPRRARARRGQPPWVGARR